MSTANVIERNIHNNMIRISDKVISYIKLAISDTIYQPAKNRLVGSCEFAKIYISAVYSFWSYAHESSRSEICKS